LSSGVCAQVGTANATTAMNATTILIVVIGEPPFGNGCENFSDLGTS
jgi:hypothetical protein